MWRSRLCDAIAYAGGLTDSPVTVAPYTIQTAGQGGSDYVTTYGYDVLNHLVSVSMTRSTGTQTRSFAYNGALLISATNPENGHVTYTYNSGNKVATRTDAKNQQAVYSYDSYARLTKVQRYPVAGGAEDTCQQENYYYDSNPFDSNYSQNVSGRLAAVEYMGGLNCNTAFKEMYSYASAPAPTGKRLRVERTIAEGSPYTGTQVMDIDLDATFAYDNEGRVTSEQYPASTYTETWTSGGQNGGFSNSSTAGPNLGYHYDSMGRLLKLSDVTANQDLTGSATYNPAGQLLSIAAGGFGAYQGQSRGYNSLDQLTYVNGIQYNYPSTGNNGKIASQTDAVSGEQVSYTYDSLNRLATAVTSDNPNITQWGQSFSYDGFGNLTDVNVIKGSAPTLHTAYDANNHGGGYTFDANGNATSVGPFDIENRLASAGGVSYSYAPGNKRVWRGTADLSTDEVTFWSPGGQKLGTYQLSSNASSTIQFYATQTGCEYYFGGMLIKNAGGWVYPDRLGSIGKFYPYGLERPSATANGTEKFTGYFRDSDTGLDYADQRYEAAGTGRFLTADPYEANNGGDGDAADPGSWNRYAYTRGDPVNRLDPGGTEDIPTFSITGHCGSACEGPTNMSGNLFMAGLSGMFNGRNTAKWKPWLMAPPVHAPGLDLLNGPATPQQQKQFKNALLDAAKRLTGDCAKLFGDNAKETLYTSAYDFTALFVPGTTNPWTTAYAATNTDTQTVTINLDGHFFNLHPDDGSNLTMATGLSDTDFQAFVLLHELGHLTGILGNDAADQGPGTPAYEFNKSILADCFGKKNWNPN